MFLISAIVEPVGYSYVLPAAKCDLQMTDSQRGFIASVPYIGTVITSFPWGYMVDTQGRKRTIIYSALSTGFFAALSAFMPELISFTICKFLSALCIAGAAAVPYSYIAEIVPERHRDMALSVTNAMQILGSAIVPLLAWAILPLDFRINFGAYEFRSWRLLTILNGLFFVLSGILMLAGPESPKYLASKGRHDEAMEVLQTIYARNKGKSADDFPVKRLKMPEQDQRSESGFLTSLKEQSLPLMKPPYLKWMCLNGFLLFGIFSNLNGLYVWVPDVLNRVITGGGEGQTACQVIAQRLNETQDATECNDSIETITFVINVIANTACAMVALAGSSTIKIVGKKNLLVTVYCLIGLFCIMINFITQDLVFAALLSSIPIMGLGIGPINAFASEIFPTSLRGMAISLGMMLGRTGSIFGANIGGLMLNTACEATFYFFGGLLVFCGVLSLVFMRSSPNSVENQDETNNTRL